MIELDQLTKKYGDKIAVDNISATIPAGVVTGFLGPNVAGKSTTRSRILWPLQPTIEPEPPPPPRPTSGWFAGTSE